MSASGKTALIPGLTFRSGLNPGDGSHLTGSRPAASPFSSRDCRGCDLHGHFWAILPFLQYHFQSDLETCSRPFFFFLLCNVIFKNYLVPQFFCCCCCFSLVPFDSSDITISDENVLSCLKDSIFGLSTNPK